MSASSPAARLSGLPPVGVGQRRETISVVVTAWRRRQFLADAIGSAQSAKGVPFELVVVADFHDDELEREVEKRQGTWVLSRETRQGAMTADGIRAANGSLIAFLDDDDLFAPERLDEIWSVFEQDPELGFFHNRQAPFRDGERPSFLSATPRGSRIRIPLGRRLASECDTVWTMGGGHNGSSTVMRRGLLTPHLAELAEIRKAVPPYLFYRAWCSSTALVMDPRPLTGERIHSANTTPNRFQERRARFARLASIATDLAADAEAIRSFVPPDVWAVPLLQMSSMGQILAAVNSRRGANRRLACSALELLRRRRTWLPRWILVSLAVARMGSRTGARVLYEWLTYPG